MKIKRVLLAVILFTLIATPAFARKKARIDGVTVSFSEQLMLNFIVENAFTRDIEEAIKSGLPTTFTYVVKVSRKKGFWFDEHIGTWEFDHTVKYDALKEEYEITIGEKNRQEKTKDIVRMKALMVTGEDVTISPLPTLMRGETYELRLKAKLDSVNLPVPLNYMLFFMRAWNFETDWYVFKLPPR